MHASQYGSPLLPSHQIATILGPLSFNQTQSSSNPCSRDTSKADKGIDSSEVIHDVNGPKTHLVAHQPVCTEAADSKTGIEILAVHDTAQQAISTDESEVLTVTRDIISYLSPTLMNHSIATNVVEIQISIGLRNQGDGGIHFDPSNKINLSIDSDHNLLTASASGHCTQSSSSYIVPSPSSSPDFSTGYAAPNVVGFTQTSD